MNPSSRSPHGRALVLGGGGAAGNAWLIGVLAGLTEGGVDPAAADLIVGTSAGATAAAQLGGATAPELLSAILEAPLAPPLTQRMGPIDHLDRTARIIEVSADAGDMRRRMGESAIALASAAGSERWRATAAARLPSLAWPTRRTVLTAVDAETGESTAFDRDSGVDLVDAVAASTAGGPAYPIGDRWYIDGGYRANADNADLAQGYDRVLVLSPFGGRTRFPLEWGVHLAAQIEALRDGGSSVETVFPDAAARAAFGDNMMDLAARTPAARAGYDHGLLLADRLGGFWG